MHLIAIERDGTVENVGDAAEALAPTQAAMQEFYHRAGFVPPWIGYIAIEERAVVGTGAFKGPPKEGRVEIAYHTFPSGENRGFATRLAKELVRIARSRDPAVVVTARTPIEPNASHRVLALRCYTCAASAATNSSTVGRGPSP